MELKLENNAIGVINVVRTTNNIDIPSIPILKPASIEVIQGKFI
jgi:hypothetical protein